MKEIRAEAQIEWEVVTRVPDDFDPDQCEEALREQAAKDAGNASSMATDITFVNMTDDGS